MSELNAEALHANAVRFLIDAKEQEAAALLLSCRLEIVEGFFVTVQPSGSKWGQG
jgi:hypothetical protein